MKRTILILLTSLVFAFPAISQQVFFGAKAGYGGYQMNDLKDFQKAVASQPGQIPAKPLEHFPGYFYQGLSLEFQAREFQFLGMDYTYNNTGGRNALSDYSGKYHLDMHLSGHRLGVFFKDKIVGQQRTGLFVQFRGGVLFTTLKTEEELELYPSFKEAWKIEFNSRSLFVEPSLIAFRKLSDRFRLEIAVGYDYEFGGVLYLKSSGRKSGLQNPESRSTVRANWTGIRLSGGILYSLNYKSAQNKTGE